MTALVIAEHDGGKLNPSTAKCVSCARGVPGATVDVVVFAADGAAVAAQAATIAGVDRVLRVDNKTTDTWEIEGVATTAYSAFISGVANKVTFGTEFSTLLGIEASGGEQQYSTFRLLNEDQERQIPTYKSPQQYTLRSLWSPADAALIAAEAASDTASEKALKITFDDGKIFVLNGFVGMTFAPLGSAGEIVECSMTFSGQGRGKSYAS
jgi:electron transfer flavoprotein alpha subunit